MTFLGDVIITEKEMREIKKKTRKLEDPLSHYAKMIHPKLIGIDNKKEALLLSMASMADASFDRGRIHSLLYGPPGTGKSQLITWLDEKLGVGYTGKKTTEAGLVGDMSHGRIDEGLLERYSGSIVVIDEIDKMTKSHRDSLLECMSNGRVKLTGGGIKEENRLRKTNTIIIATANDKDRLGGMLQQRFDFRIKMGYYDKKTGSDILGNKLKTYMRDTDVKEDITELKKYLKVVRSFKPKMENHSELKDMLERIWEYQGIKDEIKPRDHIDRFIRVAVANARLNFRNPTKEDMIRASEILYQEQMTQLRVDVSV